MKLKSTLAAVSLTLAASANPLFAGNQILNASFDISRELFASVNQAFVPAWKQKTGADPVVEQSHGGSSAQARSILEGLQADVVTFNQVADVERLAEAGLVAKDWASRFPHNASPFTSVHTILVRKGNPKGIKDWADLAKPGVGIVQVNPKTGGNGRYAVLAYYADGLQRSGGDAAKAREFLKSILNNVVIFEKGGRSATTAFTEQGQGDALVTFESEALQLASAPDSPYEVVTPGTSIQSDFPVAVVDKVADKRGTKELATGYLEFLYNPEAQEIIARNFYRPRLPEVLAKHTASFAPVKTFEVDAIFGGAAAAQKQFFDNGALFDQIQAELAAAR